MQKCNYPGKKRSNRLIHLNVISYPTSGQGVVSASDNVKPLSLVCLLQCGSRYCEQGRGVRENGARGATLIKYLTVRGSFSPSESLLLKLMEIQDLRVV